MPVRGLTILLADATPVRVRTALTMACTQAALGGACRLFVDAAAVPLLRLPVSADDDAVQAAAGLPPLAGLLEEAFASGVTVTACQTGLALAGLSADQIDPRVGWGGMTGLLADLGGDRLVAL